MLLDGSGKCKITQYKRGVKMKTADKLDAQVDDPYGLITCVTITRVSEVLYWLHINLDISRVDFDVTSFPNSIETNMRFSSAGLVLEAKVTVKGEGLINYRQILQDNDYGLTFVLCRVPEVEDHNNTVFECWR